MALQRDGGSCPAAYRFVREKQELLDEARDSLAKAQHRMKKAADKRRRDVEYKVGGTSLAQANPMDLEENLIQICASRPDSEVRRAL